MHLEQSHGKEEGGAGYKLKNSKVNRANFVRVTFAINLLKRIYFNKFIAVIPIQWNKSLKVFMFYEGLVLKLTNVYVKKA